MLTAITLEAASSQTMYVEEVAVLSIVIAVVDAVLYPEDTTFAEAGMLEPSALPAVPAAQTTGVPAVAA